MGASTVGESKQRTEQAGPAQSFAEEALRLSGDFYAQKKDATHAIQAWLDTPGGIAVAPPGDVYFADSNNNVIAGNTSALAGWRRTVKVRMPIPR